MTELFKILLFSFLFTSFVYLPYYRITISKNEISYLNLVDKNILNILILGNFILILSFFDIKITDIIKSFYFLTFIALIFFWKDYKNLKRDYFYHLIFFVVLIFFLSIDLAYNLTLYFDAQKFWLPKVLLFFNNESLFELSKIAKPEYPYFGSLIWAFFWKLSNLNNEYIGRIFYNILLCYSIYNLTDLLKISNLKKLSLFIIILFIVYDYWHIRGSQEILVFSFLLICSKYLFLFVHEKKIINGHLLILFLSLNLLIWTKNEGIFFGLFILITLFIYSKGNLNFKILISLMFLLLILNRFYIFDIYGLKISVVDADDIDLLNLFGSITKNFNLYNFYFISKNILISTIKFPYIILSLFFMIPLFVQVNFKEKNFFIFFYLILNISFIYFIYFAAKSHFNTMVATGLNRIVFESCAPLLLFPIIYLKKVMKI